MKTRADRRHFMEKAKAHAVRILRDGMGATALAQDVRMVGQYAQTPKPCSCWMCGHRRKCEGPPVRELRRMGG